MIGAIYLSVKQNEWHGFLPPLAALPGIFNLDRLAALEIAVLMGYVLAPCTAQRSLTLLSILCTHRIAAGYFRSLPGCTPSF